MIVLRALLLLALALMIQAGLGRIWPASHGLFDLLAIPAVVLGAAASQRAAMLAGCVGGLLKDTWFQTGWFGLSGFKLTLLGWMVGAVSGRLDLNHPGGRFVAGLAVSLADQMLDLLLRWLLDQPSQLAHPGLIAGKALTTGLLSVVAGVILEKVGDLRRERRPV